MSDDPQITDPATPPAPPSPVDPVSTPAPEPTAPPAVTPEPQQLDTEALKKEISESVTGEVQKSVIAKIAEALGLGKKEEEALPTDPAELLEMVENKTRETAESVLSERENAAQKQQETRDQELTSGAEKFKQLWTDQYSQLAESGRVPKIVTPTDVNDPGNIAKAKILSKLRTILNENEANGIDYVPTLKEVFYENTDILRIETTTGANAPISGGGRATTPNSGLAYEALNKTSLEDLIKAKRES